MAGRSGQQERIAELGSPETHLRAFAMPAAVCLSVCWGLGVSSCVSLMHLMLWPDCCPCSRLATNVAQRPEPFYLSPPHPTALLRSTTNPYHTPPPGAPTVRSSLRPQILWPTSPACRVWGPRQLSALCQPWAQAWTPYARCCACQSDRLLSSCAGYRVSAEPWPTPSNIHGTGAKVCKEPCSHVVVWSQQCTTICSSIHSIPITS